MTIDERRLGRQRLGQVSVESVAVAVDDALLQPILDRPARPVLLLERGGLDVLEESEELLERVVVVGATVVDEIEAHLHVARVETVERQDPSGVDDGGVEAGLLALVQVHRVEDVACGRLEAEGDVGQAEDRLGLGKLLLDQADAVEGRHPVAAALLDAGGQGECQGIEEQVTGVDAIALGSQVVDGLGRPQLPFGGTSLALGVDAGADHSGAVFGGERQEPIEPGAGGVAVLEVDRVEDGLAAQPLESGLDHRRLGGVEHHRHRHLGGEA